METRYLQIRDTNVSYPTGLHLGEAKDYIDKVVEVIQQEVTGKSITLWVRGSSGAILGALLSTKLDNNIRIEHVKKEGEFSHHGYNSTSTTDLNIILDDFMSTGNTVNSIFQAMKTKAPKVDYLIVENYTDGKKDMIDFTPLVVISKYKGPQ